MMHSSPLTDYGHDIRELRNALDRKPDSHELHEINRRLDRLEYSVRETSTTLDGLLSRLQELEANEQMIRQHLVL